MVIVSLDNVQKHLWINNKINVILSPVKLLINIGEITAVVGSDNSGKSTLLRLIAGLTNPSTGEILVDNKKHSEDKNIIQTILSYLPEKFDYISKNDTVIEIMKQYAKLNRLSKTFFSEQSDKIIYNYKLQHILNTQIKNLSEIDIYKIKLTMLLLKNPKLIIIDEINNCNYLKEIFTIEYFNKLKEHKKTCIFSTSTNSDILYRVDRIILLNKSKLLIADTPSNLLYRTNTSTLTDAFRLLIGRTLGDTYIK